MKTIRDRAKEHLPMVLLTLLSIVQALALELLWSQVRESTHLFDMTVNAWITWFQAATSFLGIIVIWLVYASTAMRFRWVPTTSDSIYPFVIGLLEFMLIEMMAPQWLGWWFVCLALIFATMTWVSHQTMRRARTDGENDEFFAEFEPATKRDFLPALTIVGSLLLAAAFTGVSGNRGFPALAITMLATCFLVRQLYIAATFWDRSVGMGGQDE